MSKQDIVSQDFIDFNSKSNEWNRTNRLEFEPWSFMLKNNLNETVILKQDTTKMHQYDDKDEIYYNPLQFTSPNLAPLINNIELTKKKTDSSSHSYNLTADFTLILDDTFKKREILLKDIDVFIKAPVTNLKQKECVKNKGVWSYEDDTCYKFYVLFRFLINSR